MDPQLGRHVDGGPRVVATDGGSGSGVIDAGDDVLEDDDSQDAHADARPDECECDEFHTDTELPCWPCFRDGFDTPAESDE